MATLFTPFHLREIELKNRIVVSPMCEYSAVDGHPQTWHLVHLGSRAVGGAALVFTEATAVEARGRISPADTGMYLDSHVASWRPIVEFIRKQGAVPGMQLAHSGRKGSNKPPWLGGKKVPPEEGGWEPIAPSSEPFDQNYPMPRALTAAEIREVVHAFRKAAERAFAAGFEVLEIHAAHGYLLHGFLSPLSNFRQDEFGGSFENRIHVVLQVAEAVREVWPARLPLALVTFMCGHREVSQNLRGTLLSRLHGSCNSLRIRSLADPHPLTSMESHPYEKTGGRGTLYPYPHVPVFRTFFQVLCALTLVFATLATPSPCSPLTGSIFLLCGLCALGVAKAPVAAEAPC